MKHGLRAGASALIFTMPAASARAQADFWSDAGVAPELLWMRFIEPAGAPS